MEFKVWADGVQRIVCGVTSETTCQQIVVALAQALGQTGRFSLLEKWRSSERLIPPDERPVLNLHKWGELSHEVMYVLRKNYSPGSFDRIQAPTTSSPRSIRKRLTFSGAYGSSDVSPSNSEASSTSYRRKLHSKRPSRLKPKSPPPYDIAVARARLMSKQKDGASPAIPPIDGADGPVCNGVVPGAAALSSAARGQSNPPIVDTTKEEDSLMKLIAVQLRKMEILEAQIEQTEKEIIVMDGASRTQLPELDKRQLDKLMSEMDSNELEMKMFDSGKLIEVLETSQKDGQELHKGLNELRTNLKSNDKNLLALQNQILTLEMRLKIESSIPADSPPSSPPDELRWGAVPQKSDDLDDELNTLDRLVEEKSKIFAQESKKLDDPAHLAVVSGAAVLNSLSPTVRKKQINGYWV